MIIWLMVVILIIYTILDYIFRKIDIGGKYE